MRIDVRGSVGGPEGADAAAARAGSAVDGDDGAVVAVLTAAGAGTRLGAGGPKALVEIGGRSLLRRAAQGLADSGVVDHLVVTAPGEHVERFAAELAGLAGAGVGIRVVAGSSASRQASVALGLKAALEACPRAAVVLVHDAARALTPPETVRRVVAAVRAGHVRVNGEPVKAAYKVRVGDEVRLRIEGFDRILGVNLLLNKRVSYPQARIAYDDRTPERPRVHIPVAMREKGSGRPTKKERRELDRLRGYDSHERY